MTSFVMDHDFQDPHATTPAMVLTASTLNKGRRLLRGADKVNMVLSFVCIFLCSICTLLTLLAVLML